MRSDRTLPGSTFAPFGGRPRRVIRATSGPNRFSIHAASFACVSLASSSETNVFGSSPSER